MRISPTSRGRAATIATLLAVTLAVAGCAKHSATGTGSAGVTLPPSKVKLAFVPGGPHPYFQPWKNDAQQVQTQLGLGAVTFDETSGWDQTKQNNVIQSLAAQGYNAFGVFGVSPDNVNSTFGDLASKHLLVASLGSCPAGATDAAAFCLATDVQTAAYLAAKTAIQKMGGSGNLVHLTGNKTDSNTQRRIAGVEKAVAETNGAVKLLQTVTDIDTDLQSAQKAVTDLIAAKGTQINAIVNTAYNPAVASASAVAQAHLPIKIVAIDDDPTILAGINDGSVAATVVQNPVGQASVGAYGLMKLAGGCTMTKPGVAIDSGAFVVTKANISSYDTERQAKTTSLRADFDSKYLSCK